MAIWFPAFLIYKSVPFWERGQCKLPPIDIKEDQKINLSNVCIRESFTVSYFFLLKRNFRIQACLLFWNCCLFKEPIHNFFLAFLWTFFCCCVAVFQNLFVVIWICCSASKLCCLFSISLNYTNFWSYFLKQWILHIDGVTCWN